MKFIDEHKSRFGGVQPICAVLSEHGCGIAPSTYYKVKALPPSARAVRDGQILTEIYKIADGNDGLYGARKMWHELRRRGIDVARCTVERLMRAEGLQGVVRQAKVATTQSDPGHERASDLVNRDFTAVAPNRKWGGPTSPMCPHRTRSCTWRSSSTCTPAPSWVGRRPPTSALRWFSTLWPWPCGDATELATVSRKD